MAQRASHLLSGVIGGLVVLLGLGLVPAVAGAGDPATQSTMNPGDSLKAGKVNLIDASTWIRGSAANGNLRLQNDTNGPALTLNVQTNQPPMKVSNKVRVDQLNADMVDSLHANQLVRMTRAAVRDLAEGPPIGGGPERVSQLNATLDVPKNGYLMVTAAVGVSNGRGPDQIECALGTWAPGDTVATGVDGSFRLYDFADNQRGVCSTSGSIAVRPGPRTVAVAVVHGPVTTVGEASLDVIYIPFGPNGSAPAPSELTTRADDPAAVQLSRRFDLSTG